MIQMELPLESERQDEHEGDGEDEVPAGSHMTGGLVVILRVRFEHYLQVIIQFHNAPN